MTTRPNLTGILLGILGITMAVAFLATHGPFARDSVPTLAQWQQDVATAMKGSKAYVGRKADSTPGKLAINLDVDNTALASYYRPGAPVPEVLALARFANTRGVKVFFNTGRRGPALERIRAQLLKVGYPVDQICGREHKGESLAHSKQRCRDHFTKLGYRLIANVGNRPQDFVGGGYDRAFRLPNYGGTLA